MYDFIFFECEQVFEVCFVELEMCVFFQEYVLVEFSEVFVDVCMEGSCNVDLMWILLEDFGKVCNVLYFDLVEELLFLYY